MSKNQKIESALDRIGRITWEPNYDRAQSQVQLVLEYLHRSAVWAKTLNTEGHWPFFDIAKEICGSSLREEYRQKLSEILKVHIHPYMRATLEHYLHWESVQDDPMLSAYSLPTPYEPIIKAYERGCSLRPEAGLIYVDISGLPIMDINSHIKGPELKSIEDKDLDLLDSQ